MLLQNRQGKTRLSKWYVPYDDTEKQAIQVQEGRVDFSIIPSAQYAYHMYGFDNANHLMSLVHVGRWIVTRSSHNGKPNSPTLWSGVHTNLCTGTRCCCNLPEITSYYACDRNVHGADGVVLEEFKHGGVQDKTDGTL